MRRLLWMIPVLVVFIPFARLVRHPSYLIVDPQRPSVDRALPADAKAVGNDLTRLFLPHHARIAKQVAKTGHVPGWDPAGFGGRPLVGNPQAGLWYPPVWLAWNWWTPAALGWLTVAHLAFGGIGVFQLCRSLKLRDLPSSIACSLWITSPYVMSQTYEGHYPHVWSACYQPWALWAALAWRKNPSRGWFLPPILALSLLTGHIQETYYLVLVLTLWLFGDWIRQAGFRNLGRSLRTKEALRRVISLTILTALTIGLVAIEMFPDGMARPYTLRGLRPTSADASKYHVHVANWVQLISPLALGGPADYRGQGSYWESLLSFGFVPFCLAIYAIGRSKRRRLICGWSILVLLTILFAMGRGFGVFDLSFAIIPGMGLFRVPSRVLFLTSLAVSVLAGLGMDSLMRLGRIRMALFLGILAVCETFAYGFALIQVSPPERFLGPDPVGRAIVEHRPSGPFRIRARDVFYGDARAFGLDLEKTNLNDSFQIGFAADLYERLYPMFGAPIPARFPDRFRPELQANLLDRMNVGLLISDRDETRVNWPVAFRGEWDDTPFVIRKNPDPLPRAYVVPNSVVLLDGPATVDRFTEYPARQYVILKDELTPFSGELQPFTPAEYSSTDPDRVEIRVTTTWPGYLVVADTWMPGWSVELDGSPARIYRGNRCQRVIALSGSGDHRVVMTYTPPGLAVGRAITWASLAFWIMGWAGLRWGNRRGRRAGKNR